MRNKIFVQFFDKLKIKESTESDLFLSTSAKDDSKSVTLHSEGIIKSEC